MSCTQTKGFIVKAESAETAAMSRQELLDAMWAHIPATGADSNEINDSYLQDHLERFRHVFSAVPIGHGSGHLLEIGSITNTVPVYLNSLRYGFVAAHSLVKSESWLSELALRPFTDQGRLRIDYFDFDREPSPYDDSSFDCVVCSEVLEHLALDPMNMMSEVNRVLKTGGRLILSTPNVASSAALHRILIGGNPYVYAPYYKSAGSNRHNREYTCFEVRRLLRASGFEVEKLYTFDLTKPPLSRRMLAYWCSLPWQIKRRAYLRRETWGQFTLIVGVKVGPIVERYPEWLYV